MATPKYKIGDKVYYWTWSMPWTFEIMSNPRKDWLFRTYYLTRYNDKDYLHWLPNYKTKRLYEKKIEYLVEPKA